MTDLAPEERDEAVRLLARERRSRSEVISNASDVDGVITFRSPLRVPAAIVAVLGIVGAAIQAEPLVAAVAAGLAALMVLYGLASVRTIEVGPGGRVALDGVELTAYGWIRCYAGADRIIRLPSVLVAYRDPGAHLGAKVRARLRPGASRRRAVVFFSAWRAGDGRLVAHNAVASVLRRAARRHQRFEVQGPHRWTASRE